MADIVNPDKTVMTHNADVYWHYVGDPVQRSQLLGTFPIGAPQRVLLPIPSDADIVLRAVPRGGRGQGFMAGPADATPVTVSALGIGGTSTGPASNYQQLRVNHGYSYGTTPTPRPVLNLLQSFQIKDDAVFGESDLTTFGVPTGMLNLKTDFNASGQIAVTTATGTLSSSDIVLATTLELQPGQGIYVAGAGIGTPAAPLITTCLAVSADGKTITLASGPFTAGTYPIVQADDTAAVQAWLNAGGTPAQPRGDLTMPPGYYRLSSSITLPTTSEGFSIIIHGSGWDQSQFVFQHGGDGFVPTSDLKIDSMVFTDLTVATGTIGDASGTIDAASRGIGIRMTAPGYTGIYNNFVMQRCRVIGWGRWGLWSDNMEVSWISQCIFRENKSGHVAFVGPDTISPNKQPNANTITDSTFDQAISAGPSDSKRTVTGSMTNGNRTLSGSGFTANDRGKFVIVHGAATGGGDLYSFIDVFNSSSNVTLAHEAKSTTTNTLEVFPVNVASILLNRANDTVLDGSTIQGNFADAGSGATNVLSDVNAIKVYNSANCRFIGIHEEDNAAPGGAAIRMENCIAMTIENWGGTSAGPPDFINAHRSDFELINCHCVSVKNSFFNDRPQFVIDSTSSEIQIDDSFIVGYINLWQQDNSWDRLRIGSGVRVYQAADPRTNQVAGNEYSYDSFFGRNLIVNGRFLDGSGGLEGWTANPSVPSWRSLTTTSQTRGGTFLNINATAQPDSGTPQTILNQTVAIPDTTGPGLFILGFDWNLDSQNGVEQTGRYVEVRLHPSSGIDEALQWSTRTFPVVQDIWQVGHIRCFLGSGTGRTIDVQIRATPGPNNVIIHFANFRLAAGKHIYGAWEQGIHDFGGRMHAPIEFGAIATTGTGSTAPPPVGATYMSMVNDAGMLKLGYNGVWTTVGTTGTVTGVAAGTPDFITKYNPAGTNIVDAPLKHEFGQLHCRSVGVWLDRTLSLNTVYGSSQFCELAMVNTDDKVYFGPAHDSTAGSSGGVVCIRSGGGTNQKGRLWVDGLNGKLTFNDIDTNTYNSTVFVRLGGTAQNGLTLRTIESAYTGLFLQCIAALDVPQFVVGTDGDITVIKKRQYIWPTTTPLIASGGPPMVLGYTTQATTNAQVTLSWMPMVGGTGSIPPGTPNRIVKYDATGTSITNAPAEDATTEFHIMSVGLRVDNNRVVNTLYASPANYCELATCGTDNIIRFGPLHDNTTGSGGCMVLLQAGAGVGPKGQLWNDGVNGNLTFNAASSANSSSNSWGASVLHLATTVGVVAQHGLTIHSTPNTGYTGNHIQCLSGNLHTSKFVVAFDGDLTVIRGKSYHWPTATGAANTFLQNDGAGNLSWTAVSGPGGGIAGVGTQTANYLTRWVTAGATITNSGFEDQGPSPDNMICHRGFLLGHLDGYTNMGTTSNRFATFYCRAVNMSSVLGTGGAVASAGWADAAPGEINRWWHNGVGTATQTGDNKRLQIYSYLGIELRGSRNTSTPPAHFNVTVYPDSAGVAVFQDNDVIPIWIVGTNVGRTTDLCRFWNNGQNEMSVSANGSLTHNGGIIGGFPPAAVPISGGTVQFSNYLDAHTLQIDTINGNSTLQLPLLSGVRHGQRWRIMLRRRTGANSVSVVVWPSSGNLINDAFSAITMIAGTSGQREYLVTADVTSGNWWFAAMSV